MKENQKKMYKKDLLFRTMQSMTNITPDNEQILKIEDLRFDFKNLAAKIINLGIEENYLEESIKSLELAICWALKSMLVGEELKNLED